MCLFHQHFRYISVDIYNCNLQLNTYVVLLRFGKTKGHLKHQINMLCHWFTQSFASLRMNSDPSLNAFLLLNL